MAVLGRGVTVTDPLPFCRDEIADCAEKAYDRLAFNEAARMFFFESNKPMKIYAAQVSGGAVFLFWWWGYHFVIEGTSKEIFRWLETHVSRTFI